MKVTVEDISNFPEFADLKLIAGRGGLNKAVEKCGILDYEFVEGVREKWYNTNFRDENMIVMTSFLYAKDNEYLIMDAVKNLTSRKCSGLIIKNIFHLPIHENVIRYADTMNFPILVIEGSNIHFEDLIVLISERIRHYELLHYRESKVDEILRSGSDYRLLESISYDINPTFKTDMVAMFFKAKGQFGPREYLKMEKLIEDSALMTASDSMFYYRDGFFIIHSREMFTCVDAEKLAKPFIEMFGEAAGGFRVGISAVHHLLWQIKNCFEESKYAASLDSGEAVLISERIRHYELLHYRESKVDEILRSGSDYRLLESISYDINPTFKTDMVAMFFKAKGQFGPREYLKMEKLIEDSALMTASDSMFYYRDGFFIIHSREMFTCVDAEKLAKPFIEMFGEAAGGFRVGISAVHHLLWQIKNCFEESKYAASLDSGEASGYVLYENLGIYKVILPYCTDSVMKEFCRDYIKPLEDYDLETKGNLLETAINYVLNGADIQKTAQAMLQHKNTIRYRLKNISNIIGMNVFETKNYEILSFAVRIFICNDESI